MAGLKQDLRGRTIKYRSTSPDGELETYEVVI